MREAILDAAARLFVEKGYVGTSTNEIGQPRRRAVRHLHPHFQSKLELFL